MEWFTNILIIFLFLLSPPWRWPHEWLKHVCDHYAIKLYPQNQSGYVGLSKHFIFSIQVHVLNTHVSYSSVLTCQFTPVQASYTHLIVVSNEALSTWLLSRENCRQVTPFTCAFSKRRRHCPVWMRQTFTFPSCDPDASISESLLNAMHSTASSIIMKLSCIKMNWKARGA